MYSPSLPLCYPHVGFTGLCEVPRLSLMPSLQVDWCISFAWKAANLQLFGGVNSFGGIDPFGGTNFYRVPVCSMG